MTGPSSTSGGIERPHPRRSDTGMDALDPEVLCGLLKAVSGQCNSADGVIGLNPLPPPSASVRHLTETDLARRWRMSERTLQAWRWRKVGPPYLKAMGRVLYRLSDIETFEADHLQGGR